MTQELFPPINKIVGPGGTTADVQAYGYLRVSQEPSTLFYDPFDGAVVDVTDRWTATDVTLSGTVTQTNGNLAVAGGATALARAAIASRQSFNASIPGFLQVSFAAQFESGTAAVLNATAHRFMGIGTANLNTVASPLLNAAGFEISTDGKMYAVCWSNGTRTSAIDLSSTGTGNAASKMPFDGAAHRYIMQYRTDIIYFYIDSLATPVASASFLTPIVQTLPVRHAWINGASPSGTITYNVLGSVVADTGHNAAQLSDGTYPWRKALIDSVGALSTKEKRSTASAVTTATATTSTGTVLASNTSRMGATIYNEGTAILYMHLGTPTTLSAYTTQVASGGYYEVPFGYTGVITGITSASTAVCRVVELT